MAGHPCMLGQECVVEKYTGEDRCVCTEHCPKVADAQVENMKAWKSFLEKLRSGARPPFDSQCHALSWVRRHQTGIEPGKKYLLLNDLVESNLTKLVDFVL